MMSKCLARRLTTLECFVCVAQLSFCFISLCVDIGFFFSFLFLAVFHLMCRCQPVQQKARGDIAPQSAHFIIYFFRIALSLSAVLTIPVSATCLSDSSEIYYTYWRMYTDSLVLFPFLTTMKPAINILSHENIILAAVFVCVCVCERKQKYNTDAAAAADPGMTWWRKSLVGRSPWVWGYYLMKGKEMKLFVVWKIFFLWFVVLVVVCWCNYSVKTRQLSLSLSLSLSLGIRLENKIKEPK